MIAPTRLMCLVALAPLVPTVALFVAPSAWAAVVVADVLVLLVAVADLAALPHRRAIQVGRQIQPVATRGAEHRVTIVVENRSQRAVELAVVDDQPPGVEGAAAIPVLRIEAGRRRTIHTRIVPTERGAVRLERIFVRCQSPLRLWNGFWAYPAVDTLHVYPALKQIGRYALSARTNRMSLLGVRQSRRIGTDNEFERLRDYSSDDQFRSIDWRATARRLRLTVRDHQSNQSQRVVFAIDCGRMMVNRTAGESLLDAALDAALTLAHVALAQRDEAGLLCYDEAVTRWLPPRAGRGQLNRMIAAAHDVQPRLVESRSDLALLHLQRHCLKRTLLVVITNVLDDRNADRIRRHLAPTVGRHLPLVVLLRDPALTQPVRDWEQAAAHPPGVATLERAGAAADILLWRRHVLADLEADGVLTLDSSPADLTADLVNRYLAIKARRLL
ncbi:MAG: DUF58 domain-containing protein [Planctomycetaceae bacterium]